MKWFAKYVFFILLISLISLNIHAQGLRGKRICIDPGHGGTAATDSYRVGSAGEREEWINLRVATYLRDLLLKEGAEVLLTRDSDVFVEIGERAKMAKDFKSDLFISIHHNASADTSANFPIIYFHHSAKENIGSVVFSKLLVKSFLKEIYPKNHKKYAIVSDQLIFPKSGAGVIRNSYGIPGVISEASFFSNPSEELRLKDTTYNKREADAYLSAIRSFFKKTYPIHPKMDSDILQLAVNQEAARMDKSALLWKNHLNDAEAIIMKKEVEQYPKAEELLLSILKIFPDNYKVVDVYQNLLKLYKLTGDKDKYQQMKKRFDHFVVKL